MSTASEIAPGELCARYRQLYVAAVCDALYELGLDEQVLPSRLRPLLPETQIVGHAVTVQGREIVPGVGWEAGTERMRSYLEMFERLTPDSVLVSVTPEGSVGHFGELTANAARSRGCQGIVLDGNLRDVFGLRAIGFQAFYRDVSPLNGIGRWEMASTGSPVTIGDVTVQQGDIVVADFDGIVIVPRGQALDVLVKAEEITGAEREVRDEMRQGDSPWASFGRHGHI